MSKFPNPKPANKRTPLASLFLTGKRRVRHAMDGLRGKTAATLRGLKAANEDLKAGIRELKAANAKLKRELEAAKRTADKNAAAMTGFKKLARRIERKLHELKYPLDPAHPKHPALALLARIQADKLRLAPESPAETREEMELIDDVIGFFRTNRHSDLAPFLCHLVPTRHRDFTRNAIEQSEVLLALNDANAARAYAFSLMETPGMEDAGRACMIKVALAETKLPFALSLYQILGSERVLDYLPCEWIRITAFADPAGFPAKAADFQSEKFRDRGFDFHFTLAKQGFACGDALLALKILAWIDDHGVPDGSRKEFQAFREAASRLVHARITRGNGDAGNNANQIRIGVLDYKSPDYGKISRNIGDYIQTLAFLGNVVDAVDRNSRTWGQAATEVLDAAAPGLGKDRTPETSNDPGRAVELVRLDRDFMSASQDAPKTWVVVYGWYMQPIFESGHDFPFPDNIRPVFLSFHANKPEMLTRQGVEYLKAHQPVGCRDWTTVYLLRSNGIEAFFSGCVTMTLNKLYQDKPRPAAGGGPIALVDVPRESGRAAPQGAGVEIIEQESDSVRDKDFLTNLRDARALLDRYRGGISHVWTSRLHCYLPCRALGVPVEFVTKPGRENDIRFEGLVGVDQAAFDHTRRNLEDKLARLLDAILSGEPDEAVYQTWSRVCSEDLDKARAYCSAKQHDVPRCERVPEIVSAILREKRIIGPDDGHLGEGDPTVDVSIALDTNHLAVLPNVLRSIVANTRSRVRFHLLTRGLTEGDVLAARVGIGDLHRLILYPMDRMDYGDNMGTTDHITVSTMDRLLLPHLLPDLDRVVYLDTDILVRGDVRELHDLDLGDNPLAGRSSISETWKTGRHMVYRVARALPPETSFAFRRLMHAMHGDLEFPVFNAGILVFNLDRMRRDDFCARFLGWADDFSLNDQELLNCYCGPRRAELPAAWNAFPNQEVLETPRLVHWAGPLKPWSADHTLFKNEWQRFSLTCPDPAAPAGGSGLIPLHLGKRRLYLNPETMKLEAVQQQISNYTLPGRHLLLLRNLKEHVERLGLPPDFRILSFGCSEGYECLDIRSLFPQARVFGCDIHLEALASARSRCPEDIRLFFSNETNLREYGPFDVIVAFNVFCSYPETAGLDDISGIYPSRTMQGGISVLLDQLNDGGILGIYNTPYFIESCDALAPKLRPLQDPVETGNGWIEKCAADGRRICDVTFTFEGRSYSRSGWADALRGPAFKGRGLHPDAEGVEYLQTPRGGEVLHGSLTTTFWSKGMDDEGSKEFTQNWTNNLDDSLDALFPDPVTGKFSCAEIGCFEGKGSLILVSRFCSHPESALYCIDPWDDVYVKTDERFNTPKINDMCVGQYERFMRNVGSHPKIVAMRGTSDDRIPELPDGLDFIYIDGDHTPGQVFKDGCNAFAKTRHGGVILFDDYQFSYNGIETREGIDRFLTLHESELEVIFKGSQVAVRKK